MSIIINTNISSLQGIRALNKSTNALNQALERLSTGHRINSSKDDAACCAISASLNKDISSLSVAQNNVQMGQSLLDTANGSLSTMSKMLSRMRDLSEQSANGLYSTEERAAMQAEIESLQTELYRIKDTTEFNGKKLFGMDNLTRITEAEARAQGYTVVKTAQELKEALRTNDANCKVMLFADINLDDLGVDETGSNWTAVGTTSNAFKGTFDGNGYTISNLKINKPESSYQGMFGYTASATIKNVTLENVEVTSKSYVGGLAGCINNATTITNCNISVDIHGNGSYTGGFVGYSDNSQINDCNVYGYITGEGAEAAGLVGININSSVITNCSSSVTVIGNNLNTGGLVGANYINSTIINCSSSGTVTGNGERTGGLVGINTSNSTITNCSSSGVVIGYGSNTGGLVGRMSVSSTITYSKTTAVVYGSTSTGAFLGKLNDGTFGIGNEYNSEINEGMNAVGTGLNNPTEAQIKDNPDLVIEMPQSGSNPSETVDTSFNLQVGINDNEFSTISVDTGFNLGSLNINISTESGARLAIEIIDEITSKINAKRTELGAVSNRLATAMQYQNVQKAANIATNSVIQDTDFAKETSNYIKSQILQNTTSSLLATANQSPSIALMLLSNTNVNR